MKSFLVSRKFLMIFCLFPGVVCAESRGFQKLREKFGYQSRFRHIKGGGTFYRPKTTINGGTKTLSPSDSRSMVPFIEVGAGLMWDNIVNIKKCYPAWLKAGITAHYGYRKNGLKVDYSLPLEPNSEHKQLWHTVNDFNLSPYVEYIPLHNDSFQLGLKVGLTVCPKLFTSIKRYDIPAATQRLVTPGVYAMTGDAPQFSGQTYYAKSLQCFGNFGINFAHSPKENLTLNFEYYTTIGKVHYKKQYYSSQPDEQAFLASHVKYLLNPDQFATWANKPRLKMRAHHLAFGITGNF